MKIKNIFGKKGQVALMQIFILVIGIVAIGYAVGSEVGVVSATGEEIEILAPTAQIPTAAEVPADSPFGPPAPTGVVSGKTCATGYESFGEPNCYKCLNVNSFSYYELAKGPGTARTVPLTSASPSNHPIIAKCKGNPSAPAVPAPAPTDPNACAPNVQITGKPCTCGSTPSCAINSYCCNGACQPTACTATPPPTCGKEGKAGSQLAQGAFPTCDTDNDCLGCGERDNCYEGYCKSNTEQAKTDMWVTGLWALGTTTAGIGSQYASESDKGMWQGVTSALGFGTVLQPTLQAIGLTPGYAFLTSLGAAALLFAALYKNDIERSAAFNGMVWQPPKGGKDCEKCNAQGILPCSDYQCRSLGQGCQLLNDEKSGEALCVWVNQNDVNPPQIEPRAEELSVGYIYTPDNTISPPDRGVFVRYTSNTQTGCIPAFAEFSFGVNTTEASQCKLDYTKKRTFDEMEFYFGGSTLYKKAHKQVMKASQLISTENQTLALENKQEYELAVRCQDKNGNENEGILSFKFCVEKTLDTTPPLILSTDPAQDMPIAFNNTKIPLNVYTNEPAECAWSLTDLTYTKMTELGAVNRLTCDMDASDVNAQLVYTCSGSVDGLQSDKENSVYIRCKDQPTEPNPNNRNENAESYVLNLKGTRSLEIDTVGPNETISENAERVLVTLTAETSAGYEDGKSTCYYATDANGPFDIFINTHSTKHTSQLQFTNGPHTMYIRCVDAGGNAMIKPTSFIVESDFSAPIAVRVYRDSTKAKIVTNENAKCVYSFDTCDYNFDEGISIRNLDSREHYIDWLPQKTYYVKCRDDYGNEPKLQSECTVIVQPFERGNAASTSESASVFDEGLF